MNSLLSLGGWSVIPDLATRYLLDFVYKTAPITRVLRLVPSAPGTPQYRRHYGITFAIVVLGYLLYTMVEKARTMPPNFYEILGVPHTVDENGLKLAFRQFARKNHPDRPGIGSQGEALFIYVRDAYEALKDPATRFAYDRFGPEALSWKQTSTTPREFLRQGLLASSGYHIVAFVVLLFWSAVGQASPISFWRYIIFASLLAAELLLILSPSPSLTSPHNATFLHYIFPNRVAYQHILFLHQLFMFLSVAITRVAPYLIPQDEFIDPRLTQHLLERTVNLISVADRETSKLLHTELQAISSDVASQSRLSTSSKPRHPNFAKMEPVTPLVARQILTELAPEMEQLVIETNLKNNSGPLKTAWEAAIARAHAKIVAAREATNIGLLSPNQEPVTLTGSEPGDEQEEIQGHSTARGSRETTPTAQSRGPQFKPHTVTPVRSPRQQTPLYGTPIKQEDDDSGVFGGSSFFEVGQGSPERAPSTPDGGIPRSMLKSVPRTPGELPSPRPSPSPPPSSQGQSPSIKHTDANAYRAFAFPLRGYFAKGTANEEDGSKTDEQIERIRARSLSC